MVRMKVSKVMNKGLREESSPRRIGKTSIQSFLDKSKKISLIDPSESKATKSKIYHVTRVQAVLESHGSSYVYRSLPELVFTC